MTRRPQEFTLQDAALKAITTPQEAKLWATEARQIIKAALQDSRFVPDRDLYRSPAGYEAWNDHAALAGIACLDIVAREFPSLRQRIHDLLDNDPIAGIGSLISWTARSLQAPPRYLDAGLAEALHHTDLPELGGAEAPPMPLPAFRLFLPHGLLRTETDFPIDTAIVVDRQLVRQLFLNQGSEEKDLPAPGRGFCALFLPLTGETYFRDFQWDSPDGPAPLGDASDRIHEALRRAVRLCAHAILVMTHKSELITTGELPAASGVGFGRKSPGTQPLPPVWIGRGHERKVSRRCKLSDIRSGRSVRPHWRRGHWRQARCGEGRKQHRMVWIKPIYVNPPQEPDPWTSSPTRTSSPPRTIMSSEHASPTSSANPTTQSRIR